MSPIGARSVFFTHIHILDDGVCVEGASLGSVSAYARLGFFLFTFSFVFILFFSSTRRVNIPFYFLVSMFFLLITN